MEISFCFSFNFENNDLQLSCHVQKLVGIYWPEIDLQQYKFVIKTSNFEQIIFSEMGPRTAWTFGVFRLVQNFVVPPKKVV